MGVSPNKSPTVLGAEFPAGKAIVAPLGAVSPLWLAFGAAASAGVAYWWLTRWMRPVNLEARAAASEVAVVETAEIVEVIDLAPSAAPVDVAVEAAAVEAAALEPAEVVAAKAEPTAVEPAAVAQAPLPLEPAVVTEPAPAVAAAPEAAPEVEAKPAAAKVKPPVKARPAAKPEAVSAPVARAPRRKTTAPVKSK